MRNTVGINVVKFSHHPYRRTRVFLFGLMVLLLVVWALAGCIMGGEDEVKQTIPWIVVLGGGVAGEREQLACRLFTQGNGRNGVILTGGNVGSVPDSSAFIRHCGIPVARLKRWPDTANTYEEMSAVKQFLLNAPGERMIIVSDALHMPRLHYLRDKFALNGQVFFRQSHLDHHVNMNYLIQIVKFWFREPLAYVFYRIKY